MRKLIGLLIATIICNIGFGQNYHEEFGKYFQPGDTIKQLEILTKWETATPKDPELFTSYFNYYFSKSRDEILVLAAGKPPKGEQALILKDSKSKEAGYIGSQVDYGQLDLQKAFSKINQGIELFPNRLDMRFGKIYVLGQIKDWTNFTSEIIRAIDYSSKNSNKWTWTNNMKQQGGKDFFLSSLQDYQMQLYNTGDDGLLSNMQDIANVVLKYYPDHIESLSNLSIAYLVTKKYEKALVPLLKAEKLNQKDFIVLTNIAYAYKENGEKGQAIKYYERVLKFGDAQAKKMAKEEIEKLRK
jgi:tetratricopeptide (TPR) repeat protein